MSQRICKKRVWELEESDFTKLIAALDFHPPDYATSIHLPASLGSGGACGALVLAAKARFLEIPLSL